MRAAVIYEHGGPGSIKIVRDFPDPQPGPEDVILKVRSATLNYHDIFTRRGMPGIKVPMPCIMGVDFSGDIVETGSAVTGWKTPSIAWGPADSSARCGTAASPNIAACPRIIWFPYPPTCPTTPRRVCP